MVCAMRFLKARQPNKGRLWNKTPTKSCDYTIEFLGIWEEVNNPTFNSVEFDIIKTANTF